MCPGASFASQYLQMLDLSSFGVGHHKLISSCVAPSQHILQLFICPSIEIDGLDSTNVGTHPTMYARAAKIRSDNILMWVCVDLDLYTEYKQKFQYSNSPISDLLSASSAWARPLIMFVSLTRRTFIPLAISAAFVAFYLHQTLQCLPILLCPIRCRIRSSRHVVSVQGSADYTRIQGIGSGARVGSGSQRMGRSRGLDAVFSR